VAGPEEGGRGGTTGSRTRDRWATFDCYGTLIDWDGGIVRELERLFGVQVAPRLLDRYHELEPQVQDEPYRSYREVLTLTLERLAVEEGLPIPEGETDSLAKSLPSWEPFAEVPAVLEELRRRGWRLAILSNSDRDLIAASRERIGVPFDRTIVAEDVGSYKPNHVHWEAFFERTGADRDRHVHVAASVFHDIAPANELELRSVWINRLEEEANPKPTRELPDLSALPDTLDELVPA
jgi:2-haloacid dehalogenase